MKTLIACLVFFTAVACFLTACDKTGDRSPADTVTVQLKWVHQAQFAGFYLAKENGYYAQENLNVHFLEGGTDVDLTTALIDGRADFAVLSPEDLLIQRSQGKPLTAIAAVYRRSAVVYLSRADSGIQRPFDFKGKTAAVLGDSGGIRDFELQFFGLLSSLNIDPTAVQAIPYDPQYKAFIDNEVDVTGSYLTGGLIKLRRLGLNPNVIWPGDYGLTFYSDTLATRERIILEQPDRVTRFLRATLKGWKAATGNPEAALASTLKYARIRDEKLQMAMLQALMPLVHTGEDKIGWMTEDTWAKMIQTLGGQGFFPGPVPPASAVHTTQFLETVYGRQQ